MNTTAVFYAWVQVNTGDYVYWNPLSPTARETEGEAERDVADYIEHKKHGTGGFREGAPCRTEVRRSDVIGYVFFNPGDRL